MTCNCFKSGRVCSTYSRYPTSFLYLQCEMFVSNRLFTVICFTFVIIGFLACNKRSHKNKAASVLLFNGTGVSLNDVAAIETILDSIHCDYSTISSSDLNAMSVPELRVHRLLIVPGGDFVVMGNSLKKSTGDSIRRAVKQDLNYMGICAGAFLAGNSAYYNGFNLTSGVTFAFYSAETKGIRKRMVSITDPGGRTLDQYWEDGPQLTGWGDVAAKYPDGTPAVSEGKYGRGFVALSGIHAEAPANWRDGMTFTTTVTADNAYAAMLIRAALNGAPMPHY